MVQIKPAKIQDIQAIQEIERQYYEGFSCPTEVLEKWIKKSTDNFLVAVDSKHHVVAFLFFEYLDEIKAIPFIHEPAHSKNGKHVYVSEVGVLDKYLESDILQTLFDSMKRKATLDDCHGIVWLTGSKRKHDQAEQSILAGNSFIKHERVKDWEAYPNHHVNDHYIWYLNIPRGT